jgi:hypothetical protein
VAKILHFVNRESNGFREFVIITEGDDEAIAEMVKEYVTDNWELSGQYLMDDDVGGLPTERELHAQ